MTPFSVLMCLWAGDNPGWFRAAFDSVLHQTMPPAEILLVVDGPVPEGLEKQLRICEANPLCRVIRLPENRGHGIARQTALEHCRYALAALMDADDLSLPDRFETQLAAFAADPGLSAVGGQIGEFFRSPKEILGYRLVKLDHREILQDMKIRCPMNQVTVMLKTGDVRKIGGYRDCYCNEDYDLWLRMAQAGLRFVNLPQTLVLVRVGEDTYRRRGGWAYFRSELSLQNRLLAGGWIGPACWLGNVAKRLTVQLLLPKGLRCWIFQKLTRKAEYHGGSKCPDESPAGSHAPLVP